MSAHAAAVDGTIALRDLIDLRAAEQVEAPFLQSANGDARLSFAQLADATTRLRGQLTDEGVAPGSRLALIAADPISFARTFLAGIAGGYWLIPLDPTVSDEALERQLEQSAPTGFVAVLSDRPKPIDSTVAWIDLVDPSTPPARRSAREGATPTGTGGVVLSSSGTTGAPKIMALAERQLVQTASLVAHQLQLGPEDRGFCPLPLWHVNAQVVGLLASASAGSSLVLDSGFHRTDFWSILERTGTTWINAVPAIVARLAELRPGEHVPRAVRVLRSASAPLPPSLQERFERETGIPIVESYGMTEAASQICANPVDGLRKTGSVGPPVGVRLRIAPDGASLGADGVGHVEIKGPTVITSYESAGYEARFDGDGWLRTGDLGYLDEDGYLYLVGRSDDVINRGGEKIFPREVEDALLRVEGVAAAAVIGVPDDVYGQVPVAFLRLEGVTSATPAGDIERACAAVASVLDCELPRTRRPARLLVVEAMPAHAVGKVSTSKLRSAEVEVLHRHELA